MTVKEALKIEDIVQRQAAFREVWTPLLSVRELFTERAPAIPDSKLSCLETLPFESVPQLLSIIDESIGKLGPENGERIVAALRTLLSRSGDAGDRFPGCVVDGHVVSIAALMRVIARHQRRVVELEPLFRELWERWRSDVESDPNSLSLRPHFRSLNGFALDQASTDPIGTADECLNHVNRVHTWLDQTSGVYRVFLPVTHPGGSFPVGAMIVVRISAITIAEGDRPKDGIVVAPWSFFLPSGDSHFSKLREALKSVLRSLNYDKSSPLEQLTFVLDLCPLSPADIGPPESGMSNDVHTSELWPLMPSSLEVSGPSMGVAIGLAAWAASSQRLLRPVIATGSLDAIGKVGEIGGLEEKTMAALALAQLIPGRCSFVYPRDNAQSLTQDQRNRFRRVEACDKFEKLLKDPHNFLTDGFDDWRNFVGLEPSKQDKTGFGQSAFSTALKGKAPKPSVHHPGETDWASLTIVTSDDLPAVRCEGAVSELATQLSDTITKSPKGGLCYLTLPFQNDPTTPAGIVFEELVRKVWATKDRATLPDELVVVPINLADAELSALTAPESALACALRTRFSLQIEEAAFSNAAGQPGKLALVVHDNPSNAASCWVEERFEPQRHLIAQLKELAKTQWVIAICSDYHHECLWDDPLKKLREVPTASAVN